jgi:hypothetical protein
MVQQMTLNQKIKALKAKAIVLERNRIEEQVKKLEPFLIEQFALAYEANQHSIEVTPSLASDYGFSLSDFVILRKAGFAVTETKRHKGWIDIGFGHISEPYYITCLRIQPI